jgi:TonB family protein
MSGPSLRPHNARAAVTDIYFQPDTPTTLSAAEAKPAVAHPVAEVARKTENDTEQASNTQAGAADEKSGDDNSGDSTGQGLAPFSSWSMNSMAAGFTVFNHQIKTALPVFTPDPPIMHGEIPGPARGKDLVVEVVIDDQGSIVQATVLQGIGFGVENSIMETLRRWIFVPAKVNGMGVASRRQLRFHFPG